MSNLPDDQLDELFRRMSRSINNVFSRYNSDITPSDRELLRYLRQSLAVDLDEALHELRARRRHLPPGLGLFGLDDPEDGEH